jgi:hypothetical protein
MNRRSRLMLGTLATVAVIYWMASGGSYTPPKAPTPAAPLYEWDAELLGDNIWDDLPPVIEGKPQGNAAAPPKRPPRPDDPKYYLIDGNGDHYLTNIGRKIAPLHPAKKDMIDPDDLFPDVDLEVFLKPPTFDEFPTDKLSEIISDPLDTDKPWKKGEHASDSWNAQWTPPENWDAKAPGVKHVQWPYFKTKDREWENKDQKIMRLERQEAVRRGFAYAWQKYKDTAWGESLQWFLWLTL